MIPHKLGGLAALILAGVVAVGPLAAPASAAPATPLLVIDAPVTYLGYAPGGAVPATIRIENRGSATARGVLVRLRLIEKEGITLGLPGGSQDCESDATRAACTIGDLPAGGSATLTYGWRLVRQHYDESAALAVSVTADNAVRRAVITGAGAGTDTSEGHESVVDVVVPRNVRMRPGGTATLPIHLSVAGDTAAEGVYAWISFEPDGTSMTLTGPRGSTCVRLDVKVTATLLCYLAERVEPGTASKTWGTANPFRVTAASGSARSKPYELSIMVNAAGGWYRNVGRSGDGSWLIRPTVPLTTTVSGNGHEVEDALVRFRVVGSVVPAGLGSGDGAGGGSAGVTGGGAVAGGDVAGGASAGDGTAADGLPVTGASTALSAGIGMSLLALGLSAVAVRRRRGVKSL
jgi:hypothetical protein